MSLEGRSFRPAAKNRGKMGKSSVPVLSAQKPYFPRGFSHIGPVPLSVCSAHATRCMAPAALHFASRSPNRSSSYTAFRYIYGRNDYKAPVFGTNSFMGFRFSTNENVDVYYGWLEVTWNGTDTFQILAAAYEDTPNTAIAAGSTGGGAVPEPASSAIVALLMGGTALRQWRKKRCENDTANNSVAL